MESVNFVQVYIFAVLIIESTVDAACLTGEYECCNRNCVPNAKINDTFNDCGDNSDEVGGGCCPKSGQFLCTEGGCVARNYVLDGDADCLHDTDTSSDEAKLIGTECARSLVAGRCCQCELFVVDSECRDVGAEYQCQCISGYYENTTTLRQCYRRKLGDQCNTDTDCYDAISFTICRGPADTCDCQNGWYIDGAGCTRRLMGSTCTVDTDCSGSVAHSECVGGVCQCVHTYLVSATNDVCDQRTLSDPCMDSSQCSRWVTNSTCTGGTCECEPGFAEELSTTCTLRQIGSGCTTNEDCYMAVSNSQCNTVCECIPGSYSSGDKSQCMRRKLTDSCSVRIECSATINNSDCVSGSCTCEPGYQQSDDLTTCTLETITITSPCVSAGDCSAAIGDSTCSGGACSCIDGYMASVNLATCTIRTIGDPCSQDLDCDAVISNSHCTSDKCMCDSGYYSRDDSASCIKRKAVTDLTVIISSSVVTGIIALTVIVSIVLILKHRRERSRAKADNSQGTAQVTTDLTDVTEAYLTTDLTDVTPVNDPVYEIIEEGTIQENNGEGNGQYNTAVELDDAGYTHLQK